MKPEMFRNRLIMVPMSRGTDLPFRRLVSEWGGELCVGEMAFAHKIVKRARSEMPLIRRHHSEKLFGVQLAGKRPEVMAEAAVIVEGEGADFIDINLGCPIQEATRRGFGAALLNAVPLLFTAAISTLVAAGLGYAVYRFSMRCFVARFLDDKLVLAKAVAASIDGDTHRRFTDVGSRARSPT